MRGDAVLETLRGLTERGIGFRVGGGWGVDAPLGGERRRHADLDVSIRADDLDDAIERLEARGFVVVTDWLSTRIALRHDGLGEIDLHPIHFEADGSPDVNEGRFAYAAGSFTHGTIMGVTLPCIDADLQRTVHLESEPGPKDRADVEALAGAGLIDLPVEYR